MSKNTPVGAIIHCLCLLQRDRRGPRLCPIARPPYRGHPAQGFAICRELCAPVLRPRRIRPLANASHVQLAVRRPIEHTAVL